LCIVEHIACIILEDVADYVEEIRQARCRQANERRTENEGNNLKHLTSDRLGININEGELTAPAISSPSRV